MWILVSSSEIVFHNRLTRTNLHYFKLGLQETFLKQLMNYYSKCVFYILKITFRFWNANTVTQTVYIVRNFKHNRVWIWNIFVTICNKTSCKTKIFEGFVKEAFEEVRLQLTKDCKGNNTWDIDSFTRIFNTFSAIFFWNEKFLYTSFKSVLLKE